MASFYQLSQHNYGDLSVIVTRDPSTVALLSTANEAQVEYIGNLDSETRVVANVNPVVSIIDTSTVPISSDSLLLTISGTGFSGTNISTNVLTFTASQGTTVRGEAYSATRTNLVIKFSKLALTNVGALYVSNEVQTDSANWTSLSRQVATVVATGPYFEPSNGTIISSDSTLLTLNGTGFDASDPSQQIVTFNVVQGSSSSSSSSSSNVTGSVIQASMTQLVVQFYTLGSSNEGILYATITVNDTYDTSSEIACTVLSTNPKLTECGDSESACYVNESSSVPFTLHGLGFSQTNDENCTDLNTVTLSPEDSTQPDLYATISSCTFSFLHSSYSSSFFVFCFKLQLNQ